MKFYFWDCTYLHPIICYGDGDELINIYAEGSKININYCIKKDKACTELTISKLIRFLNYHGDNFFLYEPMNNKFINYIEELLHI